MSHPAALQTLSNRIALFLHNNNGVADERLAALLSKTATSAWQAALCDALLHNDAWAAEVAGRSYWHGNGFLKIVLLNQGFKLRLHLWLPCTVCEENIHDHRWSIASAILAGELHSEIWADTDTERAELLAQEYRYEATRAGQMPRAVPLPECTPLQLVGRTCHTAGNSYALPPETLHRICNHGDRLVATLMCSSEAHALHSRLIAGKEGLLPDVSAQRVSVPELRAALVRFLALTQAHPSSLAA